MTKLEVYLLIPKLTGDPDLYVKAGLVHGLCHSAAMLEYLNNCCHSSVRLTISPENGLK